MHAIEKLSRTTRTPPAALVEGQIDDLDVGAIPHGGEFVVRADNPFQLHRFDSVFAMKVGKFVNQVTRDGSWDPIFETICNEVRGGRESADRPTPAK